jgi:hypothetical protein
MNRFVWLLLAVILVLGKEAGADEVRVGFLVGSPEALPAPTSAYTATEFASLPSDIDALVYPAYPARGSWFPPSIEMWYYCYSGLTGALILPCHITLDTPVARENSGGHYSGHLPGRPTGNHNPPSGWAESNGYFRSTFHASEVGGVVESVIHCETEPTPCVTGKVVFGVAFRGLEDLGPGEGYELKGSKAPHPSNHWGTPELNQALRAVAAAYRQKFPTAPALKFNDISLEYGGVFDVETENQPGYDWTPPHKAHRIGKNIDISFPAGKEHRDYAAYLFLIHNIKIATEPTHWHMSYND